MKKKQSPKVLVLHGVYFIIVGIVLMLIPLAEDAGMYLDLAGFGLMCIGLLDLHFTNVGFTMAAIFAAACALLSLACTIWELGHIVELLPMVLYIGVLYFMCTDFKKLALMAGDEHSAHHFIAHMKLDILAMVIEIAVHAASLPHWVGYIALAFAVFAEFNLMLLMWRFRKIRHGQTCNGNNCAA